MGGTAETSSSASASTAATGEGLGPDRQGRIIVLHDPEVRCLWCLPRSHIEMMMWTLDTGFMIVLHDPEVSVVSLLCTHRAIDAIKQT